MQCPPIKSSPLSYSIFFSLFKNYGFIAKNEKHIKKLSILKFKIMDIANMQTFDSLPTL